MLSSPEIKDATPLRPTTTGRHKKPSLLSNLATEMFTTSGGTRGRFPEMFRAREVGSLESTVGVAGGLRREISGLLRLGSREGGGKKGVAVHRVLMFVLEGASGGRVVGGVSEGGMEVEGS